MALKMMSSAATRGGNITFVLGAGVSRAVSYPQKSDILSPLDRDFFDLLQRLDPKEKDELAVQWCWIKSLSSRSNTKINGENLLKGWDSSSLFGIVHVS